MTVHHTPTPQTLSERQAETVKAIMLVNRFVIEHMERACNRDAVFEDLVVTLKATLALFDYPGGPVENPEAGYILDDARAALAKVRETGG